MKKNIRTERPNLFEPNVYISMVIKLVSKDSNLGKRIPEAVAEVYSKHEATMSQIVLQEDGMAYYQKRRKSGCKIYLDSRDWKEILCESEKNPFELWKGELIRTYVNTSATNPSFFIMAHHLVGDGKAILFFIQDILKVLSGESVTLKQMELVDDKELRKRIHFPKIIDIWIHEMNRKWLKHGKTFTWEDYKKIHQAYWNSYTSHIEIKEYLQTEVDEMKAQAPKGVTLNSNLIARLAKERPNCKSIGIPVSIRENNESMSNQTSGIAIKYQYHPKKKISENMLQVHKSINKILANASKRYFILVYMATFTPSLIDGVIMESQDCFHHPITEKLARRMGYLDGGNTDLGVTNLTTIDIESEYQSFQVDDIYFIPPKVSYSNEIIGIATFRNKLSIVRHEMKFCRVENI